MVMQWYNTIVNNSLFELVGVPVLILIGFGIVEFIANRFILPRLLKITERTPTNIDNLLIARLTKPVRIFILGLGFYVALLNFPPLGDEHILLARLFRSALIFVVAWGVCLIAGDNSIVYEDLKDKYELDDILVSFLSKVIKFIVIALALVLIADEWNYDVNGFIAGLGLGGLAFALAAKDALANIFGGIIIILDKPFNIGDWIETPSVNGTVASITFRSTRVRTFAQALVTIPNSTLANESIINWSEMGKRQITFNLTIDYAGPRDKIEKCIQDIRKMLAEHPEVHPDTIMVYLDNINVYSLDIFLYFFTNTTNWEKYLAVKEELNFKILDILAAENVALAFPGRKVYSEGGKNTTIISNI